ncbi:Mg2+ transporter protein CorA-like/Zinc transport protein, partial [Macrophomina phaseolina MS6]
MASRDGSGESSSAPKAPQGSAAPAQPSISSVLARPTSSQPQQDPSRSQTASTKKRKHRGGKKRRRRQSFAAPPSEDPTDVPSDAMGPERPSLADVTPEDVVSSSFYRLRNKGSNTSLESEALLDHRDQGPLQTRRHSIMQAGFYSPRSSQPFNRSSPSHRPSTAYPFPTTKRSDGSRSKLARSERVDNDEEDSADDRTPLIATSIKRESPRFGGYGGLSSLASPGIRFAERIRRRSSASSNSSRRRRIGSRPGTNQQKQDDYDVNNPPSVPGSPRLESDMGFDDVMLTGDLDRQTTRGSEREPGPLSRDALIPIDNGSGSGEHDYQRSSPPSPKDTASRLDGHPAERDVCFPQDLMSELGRDDYAHATEGATRTRRRRKKPWPNISVLEEWSAQEKEQRTIEGIRARKISEPLLVDGRLRPHKRVWHREDDDAPFRFTYFNEEFQSTLHAHTLSELLQEGQSFRDLFIPEPPVLSDDSSDEEEAVPAHANGSDRRLASPIPEGAEMSRQGSRISNHKASSSGETTAEATPAPSSTPKQKEKRYGPRPVFWLDILNPTEAEMKVITRAFGIHPLTHEDVMMQEAREKVELFHNYYFVNYRTFEQDTNSVDYLQPVNIYCIAFREGVITIHFSMTPHMANVRRRIRQLRDYLILSSDWIAYAIIDDITDVYAPLIQGIEDEVDDIDDAILRMHSASPGDAKDSKSKNDFRSKFDFGDEKQSESGDGTTADSGGHMLRRVGETRKKVMALYRLLGNKADVIKGFAKRCNEQWEVAPKTEIGLYLGDIQDHIVTMTGNLSHYESLLSRAHGNYLAQINIRMNERAEQTNDVLGKLTVLGTIVLPMNIITGMWGMNVLVPGQETESLWWFWGITAGLVLFGITCFFICK